MLSCLLLSSVSYKLARRRKQEQPWSADCWQPYRPQRGLPYYMDNRKYNIGLRRFSRPEWPSRSHHTLIYAACCCCFNEPVPVLNIRRGFLFLSGSEKTTPLCTREQNTPTKASFDLYGDDNGPGSELQLARTHHSGADLFVHDHCPV